jgi:hypothetical protein
LGTGFVFTGGKGCCSDFDAAAFLTEVVFLAVADALAWTAAVSGVSAGLFATDAGFDGLTTGFAAP